MLINSKVSGIRFNYSAHSLRSNRGFTLVELLITCAIIGVLATMTLPMVYEFRYKTKVARAAAEIRGIEKDVYAYASEKGTYPPDLTTVNMQSLKDPWGNNYVYSPICARKTGAFPINTDFDIYSVGLDGLTDDSVVHANSLDDIIRGKDGSFDDLASRFL